MLGERRYVGGAFAQRLQFDWHHVETVEQILPETALLHPLLQIAMGGRDDPDIDLLRLAADWRHHALLEGAQDFGLHRQIHVANLVEKEGSAVGFAEGTLALGDGTGEGALDMTEELALEQIRRNCRAVERHE